MLPGAPATKMAMRSGTASGYESACADELADLEQTLRCDWRVQKAGKAGFASSGTIGRRQRPPLHLRFASPASVDARIMTAFELSAGPAVAFLTVGNAAALPSIKAQQQHSSTAMYVVAMSAAGAHSRCRHNGGFSQRA